MAGRLGRAGTGMMNFAIPFVTLRFGGGVETSLLIGGAETSLRSTDGVELSLVESSLKTPKPTLVGVFFFELGANRCYVDLVSGDVNLFFAAGLPRDAARVALVVFDAAAAVPAFFGIVANLCVFCFGWVLDGGLSELAFVA